MTKKYQLDRKYINEHNNSLTRFVISAEKKSFISPTKRPLQRQRKIEDDKKSVHRESPTKSYFSPNKKVIQQQFIMETDLSPSLSPINSRKELRSFKSWRKYKTIENLKTKTLDH